VGRRNLRPDRRPHRLRHRRGGGREGERHPLRAVRRRVRVGRPGDAGGVADRVRDAARQRQAGGRCRVCAVRRGQAVGQRRAVRQLRQLVRVHADQMGDGVAEAERRALRPLGTTWNAPCRTSTAPSR
jgi:hypothetical protein